MKIFVLGLDGATFNCLNPLMEEDVIPNIREICMKWSAGPLRTIFPPVTAPAWLALATGLNPGKTGVFDYINKASSDGSKLLPISSSYYEKRAVWDILGEAGYKVGIFNYPTLSPPPKVNGFAVSGMGAYKNTKMTFPADLEKDLETVTGGYESKLNLRSPRYRKNINHFFDDIDRIISKQSAALKYLLKEREWDFFWGVFSFTDWMQHVLWKDIDVNHIYHDAGNAKMVQKRYQATWNKIDKVIGEILQMLPSDAAFMIVSDHGAGPLDSVFYPNTWLLKKGWLSKKQLGWKSMITDHVKLFSSGSDNKYLNTFQSLLKNNLLHLTSSMDLIDMESSLAYSPEHNTMFGCISLTPKGKARDGFKAQLIEEIKQLPDSVKGIKDVAVILPEDIYSGPHVDLSPDVFFIINEYRTTVEVDLTKDPFINAPSIFMRTGGHQPHGVFMARGDVFSKASLKGISVLDIAPTILALFNVPIPENVDGRVCTECLLPEVAMSLSVVKSTEKLQEEMGITEGESLGEMKKMLQSLGYM